MVQEKINKQIERMIEAMQFYDKYGYFPFEKRRVNLTLSGRAIEKLNKQQNKSSFVDRIILN